MSFKSSFTIPAAAAISFCLIGGTTPAYADLGDHLFKLLVDDGATGDRFGLSVAISGDAIAPIGARDDNENGTLHLIYFKGDVGKGDLYFAFPVSRALGFR